MKAVQERREHRRQPYCGPVTYRRLGMGNSGWVRNLGEGGLMAELPERFAPGTTLDLTIAVGERHIHAEAEVVWSKDRDGTTDNSTYPHGLKVNRLELQKGSISASPAAGLLNQHPKSVQ